MPPGAASNREDQGPIRRSRRGSITARVEALSASPNERRNERSYKDRSQELESLSDQPQARHCFDLEQVLPRPNQLALQSAHTGRPNAIRNPGSVVASPVLLIGIGARAWLR